MKHTNFTRRVVFTAIIGATFCSPVIAHAGCIYADEEVTIWSTIERMPADQLLGMLLLFGFLIALI